MEAILLQSLGSCCHWGQHLCGILQLCSACTWDRDRLLMHPRNELCHPHAYIHSSVRIIFTTSKDLSINVNEGNRTNPVRSRSLCGGSGARFWPPVTGHGWHEERKLVRKQYENLMSSTIILYSRCTIQVMMNSLLGDSLESHTVVTYPISNNIGT